MRRERTSVHDIPTIALLEVNAALAPAADDGALTE
jgi:hypothetical protein